MFKSKIRNIVLLSICLIISQLSLSQIYSPNATRTTALGEDSVYWFSSQKAELFYNATSESNFTWSIFNEETLDFDLYKTTEDALIDSISITYDAGVKLEIFRNDTTEIYRRWCAMPVIDSVTYVVDSLTCEGLYARSVAYGDDIKMYNFDTKEAIIQEQKYSFYWTQNDSTLLETNSSFADLPCPLEDATWTLTAENQAYAKAVTTMEVESFGVKASYTVEVRDREVANEIFGGNVYSAPAEVECTNTSLGNYTVSEWIMGSATRLYDKNPVYAFQQTGDYQIKLIVTNENSGCTSADSTETITVTDAALEFPNCFTPNGDGVNDEFRCSYRSLKNYEIWIYNRWGRRVYTSTDPSEGWDGKIGGANAAEGVYMYVAQAESFDKGIKLHRKGTVTLIRGKGN